MTLAPNQLMNRTAIMTALYNLLATAQYDATTNPTGVFKTVSRKLKIWDQLEPTAKPALFIVQGPTEYRRTMEGLPPIVIMTINLFVYTSVDDASASVIPADIMNACLDAIDTAIAPTPYPPCLQTLGGLVSHAWVEGNIIQETGDLDNQGVAIVPIKILVGDTR